MVFISLSCLLDYVDFSLDEMEKLIMLLLGCVVMCEGKGPLIEKMKGMELTQQHALVAHIQQVGLLSMYVWDFGIFLSITHVVCLLA